MASAPTTLWVGLGVLALALVLPACDEKAPPPPPAPSARAPVEALDPDALLEGTVVAHGVRLPQGSRIIAQDAIGFTVEVQQPFERVASYLRDRVDAGSTVTGPGRTTFLDARSKATGQDGPELKIVLIRKGFGTQVHVDRTKPPGVPIPPPVSSAFDPPLGPPEPEDDGLDVLSDEARSFMEKAKRR